MELVSSGPPYVYNITFDTSAAKSTFNLPDDLTTTYLACILSSGFNSNSVYDTSTANFEILNPTLTAVGSGSSSSGSSDDESSASTLKLGITAAGIALAGALF